ncbi:MAG: hypothetical protein ACT60Q_09755, partial [Ferrovibrionaceae bacterium]
ISGRNEVEGESELLMGDPWAWVAEVDMVAAAGATGLCAGAGGAGGLGCTGAAGAGGNICDAPGFNPAGRGGMAWASRGASSAAGAPPVSGCGFLRPNIGVFLQSFHRLGP